LKYCQKELFLKSKGSLRPASKACKYKIIGISQSLNIYYYLTSYSLRAETLGVDLSALAKAEPRDICRVDVNSVDVLGQSALHVAAMVGNADVALALINQGAVLELRDKFGDTPLGIACLNGQTTLVSTLIAAKADIEARQGEQRWYTLGEYASGNVDILNLLKKRKKQKEQEEKEEQERILTEEYERAQVGCVYLEQCVGVEIKQGF
jgi:hypothetical protein